jgi:hypothetical protein
MDGETPSLPSVARHRRRRQYQPVLVEADLGEVQRGGAQSCRGFDPEIDLEQAAAAGGTRNGQRQADGERTGGVGDRARVGDDRRTGRHRAGAHGDDFEQRRVVDEPEVGRFESDGVIDQHRNGDDAAGGGTEVGRDVHVRVRSRRGDGDPGAAAGSRAGRCRPLPAGCGWRRAS